jgi:hypothetical protein
MFTINMSKMQKLSSGWATWKWLAGVDSKQKQWFLGAVRGRGEFESWMTIAAADVWFTA